MVVHGFPHVPSILRQLAWPLTAVLALSVTVLVLDRHGTFFERPDIPDVTVTVMGVALSILLGFRTNSAYDRWWEARKLWGRLVNSSRSMSRQAMAYVTDRPAAERLVNLQIAFAHATRCKLRGQDPFGSIDPFLDDHLAERLGREKHVPAAILVEMGHQIAAAARAGYVTEWRLQQLDNTVSDLADIFGGLERIKNTPLPRQYDVYPELFIYVYCVVLPFVLVDQLHRYTPIMTLFVAGAFLILNQVGKNLEDPFENRPYDVSMTALCLSIEINLRQSMGQMTALPEPLMPVRGVLW